MRVPGPAGGLARFPWWAVTAAGALVFGVVRLVHSFDGSGFLHPIPGGTTYAHTLVLLALAVPYGLALVAWKRGAGPGLRTIALTGAMVHLLLLFVPPAGSQDLFQYLFYGKLLAVHGANPYLVEPARFAADPWFPFITWTTQTTVYGPVWTLFSAGIVRAAGTSLLSAFAGVKALVLILDLAVMALIVALGREGAGSPEGVRRPAAGFGLLAWVLNPLVLVAVPVEGHADLAIGVAFLGAVLARRRGRPGVATLLLALGALVKAYAGIALILHLALLARDRGARTAAGHAAGSAALALVLYAPFWGGWETFGGAAEVARRFGGTSLTGTVFRMLPFQGPGVIQDPGAVGTVILVIALTVVVAVVGRLAWTLRDEARLWMAVTLGLGTYLLLTPWLFPWHLLPLVAVACALPFTPTSTAVLVGSISSLVAFRLHPYQLGLLAQGVVRYLPPLSVLWRSRSSRGIRLPPHAPVAVPADDPGDLRGARPGSRDRRDLSVDGRGGRGAGPDTPQGRLRRSDP